MAVVAEFQKCPRVFYRPRADFFQKFRSLACQGFRADLRTGEASSGATKAARGSRKPRRSEAIKRKETICLYWHTSNIQQQQQRRKQQRAQQQQKRAPGKTNNQQKTKWSERWGRVGKGVIISSRMTAYFAQIWGSFVVCIRFLFDFLPRCLFAITIHTQPASRKLRGFFCCCVDGGEAPYRGICKSRTKLKAINLFEVLSCLPF